jgi:molybdopterin converting factor small subunit
MATVQFTSNLKRFYPNLDTTVVKAETIAQLIEEIEKQYPGLKNYITDDQSRLRHHVNIFINQNMIRDRQLLQDKVEENDNVYIMQALSGG